MRILVGIQRDEQYERHDGKGNLEGRVGDHKVPHRLVCIDDGGQYRREQQLEANDAVHLQTPVNFWSCACG